MKGDQKTFMVFLDQLAEESGEAVITVWHVSENETVLKGQDLVEVVTDKATFDVPAPCDGVLLRITKQSGQAVRPGEAIAEMRETALRCAPVRPDR